MGTFSKKTELKSTERRGTQRTKWWRVYTIDASSANAHLLVVQYSSTKPKTPSFLGHLFFALIVRNPIAHAKRTRRAHLMSGNDPVQRRVDDAYSHAMMRACSALGGMVHRFVSECGISHVTYDPMNATLRCGISRTPKQYDIYTESSSATE